MPHRLSDLLSAAHEGDLERLRAALRAGADTDGEADLIFRSAGNDTFNPLGGKTALHLAAERGHTAIASELLSAGADADAFTAGSVVLTAETPLHIAARRGHVDMCRVLLAAGAKPDLRQVDRPDAPGRFPLQLAMEEAHLNVVRLLLQANDKAVKATASAALCEATESGRASLVRLLIENGADGRKPFRKLASTPLHVACFHGYAHIAALSIEGGADIHAVNRKGENLMHIVVDGAWLSPDQNRPGAEEPRAHAAVAELLLKKGISWNAANLRSETPLSLARQHSNLSLRVAGVIGLLEQSIQSPR